MTFLNTAMLWGVLAASIPIIIHLINRRRHKTIQWAAMQFLLKAARQSRGKKKLRHVLILTCRALAVAALAFAAARPIVSGLTGWGGGSIDTVILLLDRSCSMEIKPGDGLESRRSAVLEKVRTAMKDIGASRFVLIDSATETPIEVASPDALREIAATAPTDSAADVPSMLSRAADYLADSTGRAEIWLASDLQQSNWHPDDDRWAAARTSLASLPRRPAIRILSLTGPTAANTSIRLLSSRRAGNELLLDLELLRSGEARSATNLPLTTHLNGTKTTESITLPGQSLRLQKRIPLPANTESGFGWLSLPADGNPRDSVAFFAYGPPRPIQSLVVAPAGESASYLQLAAAPPGLENTSTQLVSPAQAAAAITDDLAAILWASPFPTGPAADALQRYLNSGGHVIFLPTGSNEPSSFNDLKWTSPSEAPPGKFFILKEWNRSDGPLRDGLDGTPIAAHRLKAIRRQIPTGDATPLATWEDGEPFVARRIFDHGTAWLLGSIPDYTWSNLADADVLLPLVQRILTAGAERFDASYSTEVASHPETHPAGSQPERLDDYGTHDPSNAPHLAGIFRKDGRPVALNRPAIEDSPEILSRDTLDTLLAGTGYTLLDQAGKDDDPSLARDVWRAFLAAMLLFLIAEAILCLPPPSSLNPPIASPSFKPQT